MVGLLLSLLWCLFALANTGFVEKTLDLGNGETLTMALDMRGKIVEGDDEVGDELPDDYDPASVPDYVDHDCQTIRNFDKENLIPAHLNHITKFRKEDQIVKYNSAYGIPVFGQAHITEETMIRACYLVRYLFADHEGMRRMAYRNRMYVYADKGGFMSKTSPDIGNSGAMCFCTLLAPLHIYIPAHEYAHWYLRFVLPDMVKFGYLKLPEFINTDKWTYDSEYRPCCYKNDDKRQQTCQDLENGGLNNGVKKWKYEDSTTYDFLYNSAIQDNLTPWRDEPRSNIFRCNPQHYFIYAGENFLGLESGGAYRTAARSVLKERNPNLYNLVKLMWPCDNTYISRCEDAAYQNKKSANQVLILGKSDPDDPSKITCHSDLDIPEVLEVPQVSPIPETNIEDDLPPVVKEWFADKGNTVAPGESMRDRCESWGIRKQSWVEKREPGLVEPWLREDQNIWELDVQGLRDSLQDSNERAWWLRRCCATTARFNNKLENQDVKNEGARCWDECGRRGHCPDFCGQDGYCCMKGKKKNGCDGKIGGDGFRICVGRLYLNPVP